MKTAISLPDELFDDVEACSARLKISRSKFFAVAAREFLARHRVQSDATDAWNRVIDAIGQPGDDDASKAFRKRSRAVVRASGKRRR